MISQKHIKDSERKYVKMMNESGHFAQRIAGSGCGKYSVCDIITVMDCKVFLTEVKATKNDVLVLDKKSIERLREMVEAANAHSPLRPMLAIHWKRHRWEFRCIDNTNLSELRRIEREDDEEGYDCRGKKFKKKTCQ